MAGVTVTIDQAARASTCASSITPAAQTITAAGGAGTVAVTAATGCAWTATSHAAWITVRSGSSGTGNGSVTFDVGANTGAARSGTLTIAGQTFTVNQASGQLFVRDYADERVNGCRRRGRPLGRGHGGGRLRVDGHEPRGVDHRPIRHERHR